MGARMGRRWVLLWCRAIKLLRGPSAVQFLQGSPAPLWGVGGWVGVGFTGLDQVHNLLDLSTLLSPSPWSLREAVLSEGSQRQDGEGGSGPNSLAFKLRRHHQLAL